MKRLIIVLILLILNCVVSTLRAQTQKVFTRVGDSTSQTDDVTITWVLRATNGACSNTQNTYGTWNRTGGVGNPGASWTGNGCQRTTTQSITDGSMHGTTSTFNQNYAGATSDGTVTFINDTNAFGNHYHGQFSIQTHEERLAQGAPYPAKGNVAKTVYYYIDNGPAQTGSVEFAGILNVPAYCESHSIELKVNGVTINTQSSSANLTFPQTVNMSGTISGVTISDSNYEWLVDGVSSGGVQPLDFQNTGSVEFPAWSTSIGMQRDVVCTTQPPTPTPTPTPTPPEPTPTPPVTPTPQPTSTPVPNPSTPPYNQPPPPPPPYQGPPNPGSSPLNVYEDVRAALNDSGNTDTSTVEANGDFQVGEADDRQQPALDALDQTKQKLLEDTQKLQATHEMVKGAYSADKKPIMPVGIGSTLSFAVSLPKLGSFVIDLSPYQTYIAWIRNACLFVLYIMFWTWTSSTVRQAVS